MTYKNENDSGSPTTTLYIPKVILRVPCEIHNVIKEEPCFSFTGIISDRTIEGICNHRARDAGMKHSISTSSLIRTINKEHNDKAGRNSQAARSRPERVSNRGLG